MALRRIMCCTLGLSMAAAALIPPNAWAGPLRLRVEEVSELSPTGQGVVITDQLIDGDSATEEGVISIVMKPLSLNIVMSLVVGVSNRSYVGADGLLYSQLSVKSFNLETSAQTSVRLTLEDPGFASDGHGNRGKLLLTNSIAGNFVAPKGSTLRTQSWLDREDYVPDLGKDQTDPFAEPLVDIGWTPTGGTLQVFKSNSLPSDGAFSGEAFKLFNSTGPTYSLITQVQMDFSGAGSVNFSQDTFVPVTEPGTLLLLGTGIVGLARMSRRRASLAQAA